MKRAEKLKRQHAKLLKKYDSEEGIQRHFEIVEKNRIRDAAIAAARDGDTRQKIRREARAKKKGQK